MTNETPASVSSPPLTPDPSAVQPPVAPAPATTPLAAEPSLPSAAAQPAAAAVPDAATPDVAMTLPEPSVAPIAAPPPIDINNMVSTFIESGSQGGTETSAAPANGKAAEVHAAEAAGMPELPVGEPPRALVPGAFLKLLYEVRQVVARGMTNLYLADGGGGYGDSSLKLIAERATPTALTALGELTGGTDAKTGGADAAVASGTPTNDAEQFESGAMPGEVLSDNPLQDAPPVESLAPTMADLKPQTAAPAPSPVFPVPEDTFSQEGRDYAIFEYFPSVALQDHREATNDERYLSLISQLCGGMAELASHNLRAEWNRELLRVDAEGGLHYFGFADENGPDAMECLRALNGFLLGRVLAEERTMRLDDPWGSLALSEEVLSFASALEEGRITSPSAALEELQALGAGRTLRAESALLSDVGMEREINEDSGLVLKAHRAAHLGAYAWELYVVADGMGGHEGGEVASDLTLSSLQAALMKRTDLVWNDNGKVRAALLEVIAEVNDAVVQLTQTPKYMAMRAKPGSTLTFALRMGARVFVGNVGDSRTYMWSAQNGLRRVTKDHSYVQTLIDAGELTDEEAWDHPDGSIITAHIGDLKGRTKDVFLRLVKPGDKLLLVSDGVVDMLRDSQIAPFLQEDNPATVARNLVDAANAAGGADNITVVCVVFS